MHFIEITGFLFGIAGVWLTIRKNILCFPVGMVNVLITAWLVFNETLFADTIQQLVYFVLLIAGWLKWSQKDNLQPERISRVGLNEWVWLVPVFMGGSFMMGFLFSHFSRASYPYWDSAATVVCFIAQWLIAKRKIENWILWMAANPVYIVLYLLKGLNWYALLSAVYLVMAFVGWRQWKAYYHEQKHAL